MSEETISSNMLYQGRLINLRCDSVTLSNGGTTIREIVENTPAVVIVALND